MTREHKFQGHRSEHSKDLIFGLVTSILLHCILFLAGNTSWLRAFVLERQQELDRPIPIDFVEVPPQEKKPPPETSRRAANNSVAGGEAKRDRPVSTARSVLAAAPKTSASSPTDFPAPKPAKSSPKPEQPAAALPPDLFQKPQPEPPKAATAPATTPLKPEQQKLLAALRATQPKPEPPKTAAPTITQPKPSARQENLRPTESTSEQMKPIVTPRKPSQAQKASNSGGAARLGGPVTLSSRNLGGDSQPTLPNSNRSNPGTPGVDARQDVDLGFYLEQLQKKVRQQWTPEPTQSSWQTVIHFSIRRSGQVSDLQIALTSGNSATDKAALSAVERAAPFAPLPTAYTKDYISIQFTFNINARGNLELRRGR